jgi:hypothetical protein
MHGIGNTRTRIGPVAAYFWSGVGGCLTVTLIDRTGQLSTVTNIGGHATQFVCRDAGQAQPTPRSGLTPGAPHSHGPNSGL